MTVSLTPALSQWARGIRSARRAAFTVNISDATIAMLQQAIVFG
jgi:hypothetical protein